MLLRVFDFDRWMGNGSFHPVRNVRVATMKKTTSPVREVKTKKAKVPIKRAGNAQPDQEANVAELEAELEACRSYVHKLYGRIGSLKHENFALKDQIKIIDDGRSKVEVVLNLGGKPDE